MTELSGIAGFDDTPIEEMTYEQAFLQLDEIVTALESNEYPLETTLAIYERGQKLAQYCATLLENAELKVKQLSGEKIIDFNLGE
jgi:exodeoxyribonuclease VII small subunit